MDSFSQSDPNNFVFNHKIEFFDTFASCQATLTWEKTPPSSHSLAVFNSLNFLLPILTSIVPQNATPLHLFPRIAKFAHVQHKGNLCFLQFVFDLRPHLDWKVPNLTSKLSSYGKLLSTLVTTSHKFLVLIVPTNFFTITKKNLDAVRNMFVKVLLFQYPLAGIHYYCKHCPIQQYLYFDNHDVAFLDKSVAFEQLSVSLFAYSAELDLKLRNPNDFGRPPVATAVLLRSYLQLGNKLDSSHYTRADIALKTFSFLQLLDFVLLEDAVNADLVKNSSAREHYSIQIPTMGRVDTSSAEWDRSVVLVGEEVYNFLTCAGVTSARIGYAAYLSPADGWCWILMVASLMITTVLVAFRSRPLTSENQNFKLYLETLLSLMGALLERPIHHVPADKLRALFCIVWIFACMILDRMESNLHNGYNYPA